MQKKLIKMFLQTSIGFGLLMIIVDFIAYREIQIVSNIISGIAFGVFMTGILGFWHARSVKNTSSAESEKDYDVKQTKEIELPVSYPQAFQLCIDSLSQLKNPKIKENDDSRGVIVAKTGMTWDTFGDTISFKLRKMGENQTRIVISSKPLFIQVVDYGKNLENINKILSFMEEKSAEQSHPID